jgi:hypothetical protein
MINEIMQQTQTEITRLFDFYLGINVFRKADQQRTTLVNSERSDLLQILNSILCRLIQILNLYVVNYGR